MDYTPVQQHQHTTSQPGAVTCPACGELQTWNEAIRYAVERAREEGNCYLYIWRTVKPGEVRIAVRHPESGAPWVSAARSYHIATAYPDGRVVPSENQTEVRS